MLVGESSPPRRQRPPRKYNFPVHEIDPDASTYTTDTASPSDWLKELSLQPEKLEFESDIGHTDDLGTRLVDDPSHREDFALWEELLRYRQRHYGDEGVLDIWEGMMVRAGGIHLPVTGTRANFFWRCFVDVGLRNESHLERLVNYATELLEKTGYRWDQFYECVVGGFLKQDKAQQALQWHAALQPIHLAHPNNIIRILDLALSYKSFYRSPVREGISPGVQLFQDICKATSGRTTIYGPVISRLIQDGHFKDSLLMHRFLTERQDHPQGRKEFYPLIHYAKKYESHKKYASEISVFQELKAYSIDRFRMRQSPVTQGSLASEVPPSDESDESNSPKDSSKDEFAARLFATHALTFDIVLGALQIFGVHRLGPLSLREMALRCHDCQDLLEKLNRLQKAKISISTCVFSRLVHKLAVEDRRLLLSELILSDQHPDSFENVRLQESLLVQYYLSQDWQRYSLALAVLDLLSDEGPEMFNVHFRKYVATREWASAGKLVDEMIFRGKLLTNESINYMFKDVLSFRRTGNTPKVGRYGEENEVTDILGILRRVVPAGVFISPHLWWELLKRLGMAAPWNVLEETCLWIVRNYVSESRRSRILHAGSSSSSSSYSNNTETTGRILPRTAEGKCMLEAIFNAETQAAIIIWGFRMRLSRKIAGRGRHFRMQQQKNNQDDDDILIPWVRGLLLLRRLEREGLRLLKNRIRKVCRQRLEVMFGPPRFSSRLSNRTLRRENPYSLHRVMTDITRAWGQPIYTMEKYFNNHFKQSVLLKRKLDNKKP